MWSDSQFSVPTENSFMALSDGEMACDDFQTVKRKRNNTDESYIDNRSQFVSCTTDDKLNLIFDELRYIRENQEQANKGMRSFQNGFRFMSDKIGEVIEVTNRNTSVLKTLAYKSIDIEARSRRNNLIFWGLSENYNENCFAIIRDFIIHHLDLDANNMYLSRAHRLGPRKIGQQNTKRPIIVNFRDFCDTEMIMGRAHMLKSTPFSICYDLPKEINDARKRLWAELKSVKARDPRVKFQIVYPAKLVIDGKVVRDEFPDWNNVMKGSRLVDFAHIDKSFCFDQPNTLQHVNGSVTRDNVVSMNGVFTYANDDRHDCDSPDQNGKHEQYTENRISVQDQLAENAPVRMNNQSEYVSHENASTSNNEKVNKPLIQPPIFRPFSTPGNSNPQETTNNITNLQNRTENPNTERASRSLQRGYRRIQSLSIPRSSRHAPRDGEENPGTSKNRQSGAINSTQQKQSLDNVSRGSSISPHESINRHIGENEQSQANTHQDT